MPVKVVTWAQVIGRRMRRNHLAERAPADKMVEVVRDVCGIQAQVPAAAELGICARVAGITRQDVRDALWDKHSLVRTNGPRDTKHILPANELSLWMAAMKAALAARPPQQSRFPLTLEEMEALLAALREALDNVVLTREEMAEKVEKKLGIGVYSPLLSPWGEVLDRAFHEGLLVHGPDSDGSKTTFARADQWVDNWQTLDPQQSLAEVCRRYIATYGPVTHQDFARWAWIEKEAAKSVFDSLSDELEEVKIDRYRGWIRAEDAEDDTSWEPLQGSLRLVPQYDCYVLGSYPRQHIVPERFKEFMKTLHRANYEGAVGLSLLLIDGVVAGMWQRKPKGKRLDIIVTPIVELTPRQKEQVAEESERVATFLSIEARLVFGQA